MPIVPEPRAYEPFVSPLFLPLRQWRFRCRFPRPLELPVRDGATPGTLLTGCFRGLLLAQWCDTSSLRGVMDVERLRPALEGDAKDFSPCAQQDFGCERPHTCVCGALHRVPCSWQPGRVLPPVVRLSAPTLWEPSPQLEWELVLTALGRRAQTHAPALLELVETMSRVGLRIGGRHTTFELVALDSVEHGCIGNQLAPEAAASAELQLPQEDRRLLLAFSTPLLLKPRTEIDPRTGAVHRLFEREGELDLSRLLGNLAFDLCALDLEDRGETAPPVSMRRALCEAARVFTEEAACEIRVLTMQMNHMDLGIRESRSGNGSFGMQGLMGYLVMKCPPAMVPWVRVMSHWRAGQLGSKGFGEVQIWG